MLLVSLGYEAGNDVRSLMFTPSLSHVLRTDSKVIKVFLGNGDPSTPNRIIGTVLVGDKVKEDGYEGLLSREDRNISCTFIIVVGEAVDCGFI